MLCPWETWEWCEGQFEGWRRKVFERKKDKIVHVYEIDRKMVEGTERERQTAQPRQREQNERPGASREAGRSPPAGGRGSGICPAVPHLPTGVPATGAVSSARKEPSKIGLPATRELMTTWPVIMSRMIPGWPCQSFCARES